MSLAQYRSVSGPSAPFHAQLIAEFLGTFFLLFAGTGAMIADTVTGGTISHVGVAATFGLIIAVMVYAFRATSAAQYNPAVTVALWLRGVIPGRRVFPFILTQLVAATTASAILFGVFRGAGVENFGATLPGLPLLPALLVEIAITMILVTVIMGVVRAGSGADPWSGIAIGGAVALCSLSFGPLTGASMNPARSFGPALFTGGAFEGFWIYIVGPVIGAVLSVALDRIITIVRGP